MRWLLLLAAIPFPVAAQYSLYTSMATTRNYVVGAKLPPSGIFVRNPNGEWRHTGFNHPAILALDFKISDPSTLYAAAGNGLIRIDGEHWKILTGSEVTELRDVAVDQSAPGTIYFAHCAGISVTHDGGATWQDISVGLKRKYTESIRIDRTHAGVLIAGTEQGVFRSGDAGKTWKLSGAAGFQIMHLEQSPHDACYWLASTQGGGLFASRDCGASFESDGTLSGNLYDVAFDPNSPKRIAVAGFNVGVVLSEDGGKTWQPRNAGLPRTDVWSVAFEPGARGRIYASVHEESVYRSDDAGKTWTKDGLDGSVVYRMKFVPESANQ